MSGSLRVPAFLRRILSVVFVCVLVPWHTGHQLPMNLVWLLPRNPSSVLSPRLGLVHFVAVLLTVHLKRACQTARQHTFRFHFHLSGSKENHVAGLLVFRQAILVQNLSLVASSHNGLMLSRELNPLNLMHHAMARLHLYLLLRYLRRLPLSRYLFQVLLRALHLNLNPLPFGVARRCSLPLRCTLRSVRLRSTQVSLLLFSARHPHTFLISTLPHQLRNSTPSLFPSVT